MGRGTRFAPVPLKKASQLDLEALGVGLGEGEGKGAGLVLFAPQAGKQGRLGRVLQGPLEGLLGTEGEYGVGADLDEGAPARLELGAQDGLKQDRLA